MRTVSGMSLSQSNSLADGLGHIVDVVWGDPAHGDPGGLQQVEGPLLLQPDALVLGQARVREHSNLACDVAEEGKKFTKHMKISLTSNLQGSRGPPAFVADQPSCP